MANFVTLFGVKSMVAAGSVAAVAAGSAVVYRDEISKLWEQASISMLLPKAHQEPVSLVREDDGTAKPAVKRLIATSETEPVPVPKAAEVETIKIITPTFDLLRVEPDGSVLVAGNAVPNAKVDLIDSEGNVLASADAGPEGDFVTLPDGPLKPGDYILSLRAVRDGQEPVLSAQISLVTVPESSADGEVLAMISEEGKPSEIITKPETLEAQEEPKPVEEVAKAEPVVETPAKVEEIAAVEPAEPVKPVKHEETVEAAEAAPAPTPKSEEPAVEPVEPVEEVKSEETAEAKPEPVVPSPPPSQVIVEAVEVENGQIYVAGAISREVPVRIYIDNEFIGLSRGTSDERFLVSREYDLSEGEHIVRVDVIDSKDGSVLSRAVVPLIHEVPEELQPAEAVAEAKPEPAALEPETVEAPAKVEVAAVEPVVEAPKVVAETAPAAAAVTPKKGVVEVEMPAPKEEVAKAEPKPEAKVEAPKVEVSEVEPAALKIEAPKVAKVEPEAPKVKVAAAESSPPPPPRALKTGRAVIIKRGDNLWRISRKIYGRGIRYTTIYNANRNQIANPHRIYIGQIFKIPENAEQED